MRLGRDGVPETGTCLVGESNIAPLTSPLTSKYLSMYLDYLLSPPHLTSGRMAGEGRYSGR